MDETAAELGLSYERFRKVWKRLPAFPGPVTGCRWDPEAVAAWKAARSRAGLGGAQDTAPAAGSATTRGAQRARAQLQLLRAS